MSNGEDVNDTPTPPYAGIIDKNTWAGRAGVWQADPTGGILLSSSNSIAKYCKLENYLAMMDELLA